MGKTKVSKSCLYIVRKENLDSKVSSPQKEIKSACALIDFLDCVRYAIAHRRSTAHTRMRKSLQRRSKTSVRINAFNSS